MARSERCAPECASMLVDTAQDPSDTADTASRTISTIISNLDVDDLAQPEPTEDLEREGAGHGDDPDGVVPERMEIRRLQQPDHQEQQRGDRAEHDRGEPAFR